MVKRNITLTLPIKLMEVLDKLYEEGFIDSRSQLVTIALFDYMLRNKLIRGKDGIN